MDKINYLKDVVWKNIQIVARECIFDKNYTQKCFGEKYTRLEEVLFDLSYEEFANKIKEYENTLANDDNLKDAIKVWYGDDSDIEGMLMAIKEMAE